MRITPSVSLRLPLSVLVCSWLGQVAPAQERPKDDPTPLTESQRIVHVLSRFSFGSSPSSVEEVRKKGIDAWFEEQLGGQLQESAALTQWLGQQRSLAMSDLDIYKTFVSPKPGSKNPTPKEIRERNRLRNIPVAELKNSVLLRAILGQNRVQEVMSDFWRNHFNIEAKKGSCRYLIVSWERDVIRKGVFSNFGDFLMSTARHPAMLVYLDNYISRKPLSKQELKAVARKIRQSTKSRKKGEEAADIAKQAGLNENYARELLELHTLGVDNYYHQKDVIEVAKALTGWGIRTDTKKYVGFMFHDNLHAEGDKRVLRKRIPGNKKDPVREGEMVIERLAEHRGTAEFLAWKLCRYLVDDDPPPAMVRRVAAAFRRSNGNLPDVYRAILHDPDFFDGRHFQSKFKRPFEFLVSAIRVTGARIQSPSGLISSLGTMSEPLYDCVDPTGYYDQAEAWNDPGVMALRWKFAMDFVRNKVRGVQIPKSFYADLRADLPQAWKEQLARKILPAGLSERTSEAMDRKIREYLRSEPQPEVLKLAPLILGMLLGSPEFQRQ